MKTSVPPGPVRVFNSILFLCFLSTGLAWGGNLFSGPINSPAGKYPWALAAGDFNGDGNVDVAVTNNNPNPNVHSKVKILLGGGNGIFQSPMGYAVEVSPLSVVFGDFNGDHNQDLAVVNLEGSQKKLSVLIGNGDGSFQPQVMYKVGIAPSQAAVGDFNGDGKLDVAVANEGGPSRHGFLEVLLGNGNGTFQPRINDPAGKRPAYVAVGDLNGDGRLDAVVMDGCKTGAAAILQPVPCWATETAPFS